MSSHGSPLIIESCWVVPCRQPIILPEADRHKEPSGLASSIRMVLVFTSLLIKLSLPSCIARSWPLFKPSQIPSTGSAAIAVMRAPASVNTSSDTTDHELARDENSRE